MCIHAYEGRENKAEEVVFEIGYSILSTVIITNFSDNNVLTEIVDEVVSGSCIHHQENECVPCKPWFTVYRINPHAATFRYSPVDGMENRMQEILKSVHVAEDMVYNFLLDKVDDIGADHRDYGGDDFGQQVYPFGGKNGRCSLPGDRRLSTESADLVGADPVSAGDGFGSGSAGFDAGLQPPMLDADLVGEDDASLNPVSAGDGIGSGSAGFDAGLQPPMFDANFDRADDVDQTGSEPPQQPPTVADA